MVSSSFSRYIIHVRDHGHKPDKVSLFENCSYSGLSIYVLFDMWFCHLIFHFILFLPDLSCPSGLWFCFYLLNCTMEKHYAWLKLFLCCAYANMRAQRLINTKPMCIQFGIYILTIDHLLGKFDDMTHSCEETDNKEILHRQSSSTISQKII